MGTGKRIVTTATGFPANSHTWRFIQQAWREGLGALALLAGNKTILTGVSHLLVPVGQPQQYTDGFISYNGEIMPFVGGVASATVTLIEEIENGNYDADVDNDGQQDNLPQYITRYLKFGNDGITTFPFSDLYRLDTIKSLSQFTLPANLVQDPNYVHTDNNLTDEMVQSWNALISNVQANWNTSNPQSPSFILNKPTNLMTVLRKGEKFMGDIFVGNSVFECTFPNIGTSSYQVHGSFEVVGGGDINIFWAVGPKTASAFTIYTAETYGVGQSLRFRYVLTPIYTS